VFFFVALSDAMTRLAGQPWQGQAGLKSNSASAFGRRVGPLAVPRSA
jgi:hypothetical protein